MDYGTGAIFGCPAHDQRDFDFAKSTILRLLKLFLTTAIKSNEAYLGGKIINSDFLDGLSTFDAKEKIIKMIEKQNLVKTDLYRLKDWGVSRQRYWGPNTYDLSKDGIKPVDRSNFPYSYQKILI